MQQEINLYRFLPKRIRYYITGKVAISVFSILAGILFIDYSFELGRLYSASRHLAITNKKLTVAYHDLRKVVAKYPLTHIQYFATHELSACQSHFSLDLENLARAILPGVWLTEISISDNGKQFDIKGLAVRMADMHEFLYRLKQQSTWSQLQVINQEESRDDKFFKFHFVVRVAS